MRLIIIIHRYMGVALALLMVLWCLSGFVMMYQSYPLLTPADRAQGLMPLRLTAAQTRLPANIADDTSLSSFRIEMMADRPVLHVQEGRRARVFDLQTGKGVKAISSADALDVARIYAAGHGVKATPSDLGVIKVDQWTLDGIDRVGPMHHFRLGDAAGTELYVAERTGQVVQVTTARTRLWAWLGAIPHWLYPTILRQNGPLWDQVVIWTSLAGTFLTAVGIYVGVVRFRRYKSGRWSPYRGWFYWHHITGLVLGLLTLTWVLSGCFTLNPFGLLRSSAGQNERGKLAGTVSGAQLKQFLAAAPALAQGGVIAIDGAPLAGKLYAMVGKADGSVRRVDISGADAPLREPELRRAVAQLGGPPVALFTLQTSQDAYYADRVGGYDTSERRAILPVYRVDLADKASTTFYIDPATGRMVRALDDVGRRSRWLVRGLHDIDFFAGLRVRPVWDIVTLLLLAGVTGVCLIGAWLAIRRVMIDFQAIFPAAAKSGARRNQKQSVDSASA